MAKIIEAIDDLITDHWAKVLLGILVTVAGWIWSRYRANQEWKKREFFHRINFSLNLITDGTLQIRTLSEKMCAEVFLNETAVRKLVDAATRTSLENPLIPIAKEEMWFYLNAVLNELSEQFAMGLMQKAAGKETKTTQYVICLTNECDGAVKTRKIRAMVVQKSVLTSLPEECPQLEAAVHQVRWQTLQFIAKEYQRNSWKFIEMEIVV